MFNHLLPLTVNGALFSYCYQIGEIIGNLPNKECEGARGDILMDIGPSTGYLHQVLSPSFSSYEDDDFEIIVPGIEIPSWFKCVLWQFPKS